MGDKAKQSMKVLLMGKGKIVIDDFFTYLTEEWSLFTCSSRSEDIVNHLKYCMPDMAIYCIQEEGEEVLESIAAAKEAFLLYDVPLIIVGNQWECEAFQKSTGRMAELVLKKPITARNIKDKVLEFLEKRKPALKKNNASSDLMQIAMEENQKRADKASEKKKAAEEKGRGLLAFAKKIKGLTSGEKDSKEVEEIPMVEESWDDIVEVALADITDEMDVLDITSAVDLAELVNKQNITSEETVEKEEAAPKNDSNTDKEEKAQAVEQKKKHILVVDDDPMMLRLIREQLKDDYAVGTALSGKIALNYLDSRGTDLILLDYEMPNENGAEVLEKIRNNRATAKTPVIFLTGISETGKIKRVLDLKPQGYLLKPVEKADLLQSIERVLG